MKYKVLAEDFIVEEVLDIDSLKKEEDSKNYLYYILTKKNYTQIKALDTVARIFNTKSKYIYMAGTKDRTGITKQTIAITKSKRMDPPVHEKFFNSKFEDMSLKYIGEYPFRLNLGDNSGNKFTIILRELNLDDIEKIKENKKIILEKGALNLYDDQRFGYAGNSHLIGKYILQGKIENAVYEVVTSLPSHARQEHIDAVEFIKTNWSDILIGDEEIFQKLFSIMPPFLKQEKHVLEQFKLAKNDVSRALRVIPKKIRTLYIGAYQAYLFNRLVKENLNLPEEIELCHSELDENSIEYSNYNKYLQEDELTIESFELPHMRELKPLGSKRLKRVSVKDFSIKEIKEDSQFNEYMQCEVEFFLPTGAYATTVIKSLL